MKNSLIITVFFMLLMLCGCEAENAVPLDPIPPIPSKMSEEILAEKESSRKMETEKKASVDMKTLIKLKDAADVAAIHKEPDFSVTERQTMNKENCPDIKEERESTFERAEETSASESTGTKENHLEKTDKETEGQKPDESQKAVKIKRESEASKPQETGTMETSPSSVLKQTQETEKPTESAFDVDDWIKYAQSYAESIGLTLSSWAVECWDTPISAGAHCINLKIDIQGYLNQYAQSN